MTRVVEGLGRSWLWPESDRECIKVIFDWLGDMKRAYELCKQRRTVIQAGGNMGVWPWALAKVFDRVLTAEPDPECFPLLQRNLANTVNIDWRQVAFLDRPGRVAVNVEPGNRGAQWVTPTHDGVALSVTIDSFGIDDCDLIYLDIEGAELCALKGARETIRRSKPVIALEDKNLSTRFGTSKYDAEEWLGREFGYKVVRRPHNDVVLVCE